jgi:cellulose biosynthesis protein BcsQ
MKTVAVFSLKGGVGKSTLAVNLAHALASSGGRRTLLWDLDAQGGASFLLDAEPDRPGRSARKLLAGDADLAAASAPTLAPNLRLLAADKSLRRIEVQLAEDASPRALRKLVATLATDFDRVVLDCPPGFTQVAEQAFRAADLIVEPLLPAPLSERTHGALLDHLRKHHDGRPKVLPVFSMLDRRRALHRAALDGHPGRLALPYASIVERMAAERKPLAVLDPRSPAAAAFVALAAEIERQLIA